MYTLDEFCGELERYVRDYGARVERREPYDASEGDGYHYFFEMDKAHCHFGIGAARHLNGYLVLAAGEQIIGALRYELSHMEARV